MDVSVCYLQHMRAVRPAATQLEVKRSTHKKLSKFMAHLAAAGLVKVAPASKKSPDLLTSIARAHPLLRAFTPWPGACFEIGEETIKVLRAEVRGDAGEPGDVLSGPEDAALTIACGEGALALLTLQRAGRRPMAAAKTAAHSTP